MEYDDGGAPPAEIINAWLDVVQTTFHDAPDSSGPNAKEGPAIAVHCVAGLGRAPVLVAIALIEYGKVRADTPSWTVFSLACEKAGGGGHSLVPSDILKPRDVYLAAIILR